MHPGLIHKEPQMKARALVDLHGTDIKSGEFFTADEITITNMVAAGDADDKATEADVYGTDIPPAKELPVVVLDEPEAAPEAPKKGKK